MRARALGTKVLVIGWKDGSETVLTEWEAGTYKEANMAVDKFNKEEGNEE